MSEHKRRKQVIDTSVVIRDSVVHSATSGGEGFDSQQCVKKVHIESN